MNDNITLPRKHIDYAAHALEHFNKDAPDPLVSEIIHHLRTALAAEQPKQEPGLTELARQMKPLDADMAAILHDNLDSLYIEDEPALAAPKQEPVAWLSRDEARLALWKAINSREFGNPTDDKLILDHLRQQGLWIGKVTSPALAAEQPVPTDKDSLTVQSRLDAESFREERDEARALLNGVLQDIEALRRDAEQPRHPGYVIGSHWLETAYSRICAGEAEADVLRDCGWERVDQALRRDAERYRWLRDKAPPDIGDMASVRDSHDPSEIDAAIDAAMEASTAPASAAADSSTAPEDKP